LLTDRDEISNLYRGPSINASYQVSVQLAMGIMVFSATFNNISVISWWSVLLVEETGENRGPAYNYTTVGYRITYAISAHHH
jgi:hypothetical protein